MKNVTIHKLKDYYHVVFDYPMEVNVVRRIELNGLGEGQPEKRSENSIVAEALNLQLSMFMKIYNLEIMEKERYDRLQKQLLKRQEEIDKRDKIIGQLERKLAELNGIEY